MIQCNHHLWYINYKLRCKNCQTLHSMSEYSYRDLNVHAVWLHADSKVKRGTRGLLYSGLFGGVENVLGKVLHDQRGLRQSRIG
jgi:hypothetical protein